jgi:hypothetical protein
MFNWGWRRWIATMLGTVRSGAALIDTDVSVTIRFKMGPLRGRWND